MAQDIKDITDRLNHVLEFTQTENTSIVYVLRGWFGALAAIPGAIEAGDDAWSATVLQEHFESTLSQVLSERTPLQLKALALLKMNAKASQDKVDEILGAKNEEDERLNDDLATYIASVIGKLTK